MAYNEPRHDRVPVEMWQLMILLLESGGGISPEHRRAERMLHWVDAHLFALRWDRTSQKWYQDGPLGSGRGGVE